MHALSSLGFRHGAETREQLSWAELPKVSRFEPCYAQSQRGQQSLAPLALDLRMGKNLRS